MNKTPVNNKQNQVKLHKNRIKNNNILDKTLENYRHKQYEQKNV